MKPALRSATQADIPKLVSLLADDALGNKREDTSTPLNLHYLKAFHSISNDSNNDLIVTELNQKIVGMMQLTYIPYLTHIGSWRCLIEGVRISQDFRGQGLGKIMIQWAIEQASKRHCSIIQLTSDKKRPDAIKFYQKLGFEATHDGFKLKL